MTQNLIASFVIEIRNKIRQIQSLHEIITSIKISILFTWTLLAHSIKLYLLEKVTVQAIVILLQLHQFFKSDISVTVRV